MTSFGYKTSWLAFESPTSPDDVTGMLGLDNVRQSSWTEGVAAAYRDGPELLVTPLVPGANRAGWILVCGSLLLDVELDVVALSLRTGGQLHWYGTHRVVESHGWVRVVGGSVVRKFWTIGESGEVASIGVPDAFEVSMGVPPPIDDDDALFDAVIDAGIDEDTVMKVAGHWSVNPQTLDDMPTLPLPLVGEVPVGPPWS